MCKTCHLPFKNHRIVYSNYSVNTCGFKTDLRAYRTKVGLSSAGQWYHCTDLQVNVCTLQRDLPMCVLVVHVLLAKLRWHSNAIQLWNTPTLPLSTQQKYCSTRLRWSLVIHYDIMALDCLGTSLSCRTYIMFDDEKSRGREILLIDIHWAHINYRKCVQNTISSIYINNRANVSHYVLHLAPLSENHRQRFGRTDVHCPELCVMEFLHTQPDVRQSDYCLQKGHPRKST